MTSANLRVLLVDDEPLSLRRVGLALKEVPGIEVVGTARDGDAAVDEALRLKPDLLILDVEMPGRNGLAVAAALAATDGPDIIILSAFDTYAAAAFDIEALDYLLKPLDPQRLRQAIQRAQRRRAEKAAFVQVTADQSTVSGEPATLHILGRHGGIMLALSDVVWIEAARDYVLLHTLTRSHIMRSTMTELAGRLPPSIIRVHRSAFVAVAMVRRWGVPSKGIHSVVLSDDSEVTVGPSYIQEVRTALRSLDR